MFLYLKVVSGDPIVSHMINPHQVVMAYPKTDRLSCIVLTTGTTLCVDKGLGDLVKALNAAAK
jgi:hypothetical protein